MPQIGRHDLRVLADDRGRAFCDLHAVVEHHDVIGNAHDEANECKIGDIVRIVDSRPISKLKRWTVVQGEKKKKVL